MKKMQTILIGIILMLAVNFASALDNVSYTNFARTSGGQLITDGTNQYILISIEHLGTKVYEEKHQVIPNSFGLFSVKIGTGTPVAPYTAATYVGLPGGGQDVAKYQLKVEISSTDANYYFLAQTMMTNTALVDQQAAGVVTLNDAYTNGDSINVEAGRIVTFAGTGLAQAIISNVDLDAANDYTLVTKGYVNAADEALAAEPYLTYATSTLLTNEKVLNGETDVLAFNAGTATMSVVAGGIVTTKLADNAVTEPKLAMFNNAALGYVIKWTSNGLEWVDPTVNTSAPVSGDGTIGAPITLDYVMPFILTGDDLDLEYDATLLVDGTNGLGINLANPNTWTATQTFETVGGPSLVVNGTVGDANLEVDVTGDLFVDGKGYFYQNLPAGTAFPLSTEARGASTSNPAFPATAQGITAQAFYTGAAPSQQLAIGSVGLADGGAGSIAVGAYGGARTANVVANVGTVGHAYNTNTRNHGLVGIYSTTASPLTEMGYLLTMPNTNVNSAVTGINLNPAAGNYAGFFVGKVQATSYEGALQYGVTGGDALNNVTFNNTANVTFNVLTDNTTIEVNTDALRVVEDGIGPRELAPTTVALGGYGDATNVATFTVDAEGRLTAAADATIYATTVAGSDATFNNIVNEVDVQLNEDVVTNFELANDAVETLNILDANVTGPKLAVAVAGLGLSQNIDGNLDVNVTAPISIDGSDNVSLDYNATLTLDGTDELGINLSHSNTWLADQIIDADFYVNNNTILGSDNTDLLTVNAEAMFLGLTSVVGTMSDNTEEFVVLGTSLFMNDGGFYAVDVVSGDVHVDLGNIIAENGNITATNGNIVVTNGVFEGALNNNLNAGAGIVDFDFNNTLAATVAVDYDATLILNAADADKLGLNLEHSNNWLAAQTMSANFYAYGDMTNIGDDENADVLNIAAITTILGRTEFYADAEFYGFTAVSDLVGGNSDPDFVVAGTTALVNDMGELALDVNGGNVNISDNLTVGGTSNLNTVTIANNYTLPLVDGAANTVITTDGAGLLSWQNPSSLITEFDHLIAFNPGVNSGSAITAINSDPNFATVDITNLGGGPSLQVNGSGAAIDNNTTAIEIGVGNVNLGDGSVIASTSKAGSATLILSNGENAAATNGGAIFVQEGHVQFSFIDLAISADINLGTNADTRYKTVIKLTPDAAGYEIIGLPNALEAGAVCYIINGSGANTLTITAGNFFGNANIATNGNATIVFDGTNWYRVN